MSWNSLLGFGLVTGLGYAALVLALYLFQDRLLYLPGVPGRALEATPAALGLDYETVEPRTADGLTLHGWFVPHPKPRGVLLFCHGNAGNISHRLDSIRVFHELGLSVLIFDYRGYGRSEGRPSEAGTYRDAEAAWEYLTGTRGIPPGRIVVFGRSLGAAVAAELATRVRPAALILESAFTSAPELAGELYPWLPARHLTRFRYATIDALARLEAPLLIIHARGDEIVPYAHARRLFEAAPEPWRLLELRGGHNDGFLVSIGIYRSGLDAFLDAHLAAD
ncbi:MAG: alpha/beta hydrolase [Candidatus Competibacterales bacterium]|nr:alpha/beta hydrolase [Candidatus Competibacterales bacterium]